LCGGEGWITLLFHAGGLSSHLLKGGKEEGSKVSLSGERDANLCPGEKEKKKETFFGGGPRLRAKKRGRKNASELKGGKSSTT